MGQRTGAGAHGPGRKSYSSEVQLEIQIADLPTTALDI